MMKMFPLCLATMKFVAADVTETAIPDSCKLLDGYDVVHGCQASPVALPDMCGTPPGIDACLFDDYSVGKTTQYLKKMTSTKD